MYNITKLISGGSRLLRTEVQIASLTTTLCCVTTIHCIVVSLNMLAHTDFQDLAKSRKNLSPLSRGNVSPPQAKFFLEVDRWQNGDMLYQMHKSCIVIYIHIMVISIHVCCFKCSINLACSRSGAHYQPYYTWLIVYTTNNTHNI